MTFLSNLKLLASIYDFFVKFEIMLASIYDVFVKFEKMLASIILESLFVTHPVRIISSNSTWADI